VATAIFFCVTTTHKLFVKYRDSPIMIKYEDTSDRLDNVPFPAITFNNELQFQVYYDRKIYLLRLLSLSVKEVIEMFGGDK
jgi:hypothetical protein